MGCRKKARSSRPTVTSTTRHRRGPTKIRGRGKHTIRYSNVDAELRLWVDDQRIAFDGPTTYAPRRREIDRWRPWKTPVTWCRSASATRRPHGRAERLRVLRDVYYVATDGGRPHGVRESGTERRHPRNTERPKHSGQRRSYSAIVAHLKTTTTPDPISSFRWATTARRVPMLACGGDHFFERDMLIGRALLIYWPHPWYRPIPYLPNVKRMRLIH